MGRINNADIADLIAFQDLLNADWVVEEIQPRRDGDDLHPATVELQRII